MRARLDLCRQAAISTASNPPYGLNTLIKELLESNAFMPYITRNASLDVFKSGSLREIRDLDTHPPCSRMRLGLYATHSSLALPLSARLAPEYPVRMLSLHASYDSMSDLSAPSPRSIAGSRGVYNGITINPHPRWLAHKVDIKNAPQRLFYAALSIARDEWEF